MRSLREQFDALLRAVLPDRAEEARRFHEAGDAWAAEVRRVLPDSLAAGVRWERAGERKGTLVIPLVAWFRETGTRAHEIRPKRKRALAWDGPAGNRVIVARAHRKRTPPRPFLDDAWAKAGAPKLVGRKH